MRWRSAAFARRSSRRLRRRPSARKNWARVFADTDPNLREDAMKLTPLDIQQQEFKVSIRGYDRIEVQAFLGTVADAVENLLKENAALKERSEMMEGQIINLRQKEAAL